MTGFRSLGGVVSRVCAGISVLVLVVGTANVQAAEPAAAALAAGQTDAPSDMAPAFAIDNRPGGSMPGVLPLTTSAPPSAGVEPGGGPAGPDPAITPAGGPSGATVSEPASSATVMTPEPQPDDMTPELAGRIQEARRRLDALFAARAAGGGAASGADIAAADAAEKTATEVAEEAGRLAWRAQQLEAYWAEIRDRGLQLPAGTIDYEIDKTRSLPERDAMPLTSIELAPQLMYATQTKRTYRDFESFMPVQAGDLAPGDQFLSIGLLRNPGGRQVVGWVLGRGQVIMTDNDISPLTVE